MNDVTNTLDAWVERRWDDAKAQLAVIDPAFVKTIDSARRLEALGIVIKSELVPEKRFTARWINLLEACGDAVLVADQLQLAVENLNPERYKGMDARSASREATYHAFNWVLYDFALIEKVRRLISVSAKIYLRDREPVERTEIKNRYLKRLKALAKRFERTRHGLTHGISGDNIVAGITEDRLWEKGVALGLTPQKILEFFHDVDYPAALWYSEKSKQTQERLAEEGLLLADFESEFQTSSDAL